MAHVKMSVTVPKEILDEIKKAAESRKTKVSHLVSEALAEKIKRLKEEAFVSQINKIFEDPEIAKEQRRIAEDIATNIDVKELPW
jgi:predicted nucleic acid-binding protein